MYKYLCNPCKNTFEVEGGKEVKCPRCGGNDFVKLKDLRHVACKIVMGPPEWDYICHKCSILFEVPSPRGPSDEKQTRCPQCKGNEIERVNAFADNSPLCGG